MESGNKKPSIVLLLVDGLELSSSWQGNVITPKTAPEFFKLWSSYEHHVLSDTNIGLSQGLSLFADGESAYSDQEIINQGIDQTNLKSNKTLSSVFQNVLLHNSALHLYVELTQIHTVSSLIMQAKLNNVREIYIHLFIEEQRFPINKAKEKISELEAILARLRAGEIQTISDFDYDPNRIDIGKTITGEQAVLRFYKSAPGSKGYVIGDNIYGKLAEFDSIIFCTNDLGRFDRVVRHLIGSRQRFLQLAAFLDSPEISIDKIDFLFERKRAESFFDLAKKRDFKPMLFTSASRRSLIQYFFDPNRVADLSLFSENYSVLIEDISSIIQKERSFIILDLPLSKSDISFYERQAEMERISRFVDKLEQCIMRKDGRLILLSTSGKENVSASPLAKRFLPFLNVSNETIKVSKTPLIDEMMTAKLSLKDANQLIKNILMES